MYKISLDQILPYLYLNNLEEKEDYFTSCCPVHQEKHPSFVIYKNTYHCRCFSCGYNGNIFKLVKNLNGKSVNNLLGLSNNYKDYLFEKSIVSEVKEKVIQNKDRKISLYGSLKNVFSDSQVMQYLRKKHITDQFIKDFDIQYFDRLKIKIVNQSNNEVIERNYKNRLIYPIIENDKIINYELRDFTEEQKKKVLYLKSCSLSTLFNIDNLDKNKPLLLAEGIFDLSYIYTHISKNCTAVLGISITPNQINLLNEFKEIIFFPDNDERGEGFISKLYDILEKDFYIVKLNEFKDPGASSLDSIKKAYNNKIISSIYFIDKYGIFNSKNLDFNFF